MRGGYIEHYETVRLAKDGRRLDVSLSISPIKNQRGEVVGAAKIVRDITARKQAEEQLIATTAKFQSVFNQSGIFAGIMDLEGNLREVNHLAVEACGYTRADVLDRPFWTTPWWRGAEEVQARIRKASQQAAAGEVYREVLRYWLADDSERLVDFAMHPIRDELGVVRFCTRPGSTSPTGHVPRKRCVRKRPRSARSRSVCSALCSQGRWSSPAACRSRLVMRRRARRSRSAGTGTTSFRLRTAGSG